VDAESPFTNTLADLVIPRASMEKSAIDFLWEKS
jgi:hypothetical protein